MSEREREQVRAWMKARRGAMSQEDLAKAIAAFDKKPMTRDRYSKYESGAVPFGRAMYERFVAYWRAQGQPGPDLTPPKEPVVLDPYEVLDRHAKAMQAQADAFVTLATSIDGAAKGVIDRVGAFGDLMAQVLELQKKLQQPATNGDGDPVAAAHGR